MGKPKQVNYYDIQVRMVIRTTKTPKQVEALHERKLTELIMTRGVPVILRKQRLIHCKKGKITRYWQNVVEKNVIQLFIDQT